jgi:PAS domain S-box-containing protein
MMTVETAAETGLIRLLLIEPNAGDRRLFEEYCKDLTVPVRIMVEETLEGAVQLTKQYTFDIIFFNGFLHDSGKLAYLSKLRGLLPNVPLIVLFGLDSEPLALEALRYGADDCLNKTELDSSLLQRTILFTIERKNTVLYQTKYVQLETILAAFLEHAWVTSPQGDTLYMSLGAEAIYGYPIKHFFDNADFWHEVVHPEDKHLLVNFWSKLREQGKYDLYYRIIRSDGEVRWLYDRGRAVYDTTGNLIRFEGLVRDRTNDPERSNDLAVPTTELMSGAAEKL